MENAPIEIVEIWLLLTFLKCIFEVTQDILIFLERKLLNKYNSLTRGKFSNLLGIFAWITVLQNVTYTVIGDHDDSDVVVVDDDDDDDDNDNHNIKDDRDDLMH